MLTVGQNNGIARIFALDLQELTALARSRVTRPLTEQECQQYLHLEACPADPLPTDTAEPLPVDSGEPEPTDIPLPTATDEPDPTDIPLPTATHEPEPTDIPLPTATTIPPTFTPVPPAGPSVQITGIHLDGQNYIVDYLPNGYTPALPGTHVHFFFNTVPPEHAGVGPNQETWFLYGGPNPFTGYTVNDRPAGATQMCSLVANPDHTIQLNTGNCWGLP